MRASKCTSVVSTPSYNLFISWCPDGSSLAVVSNDNTLQVTDDLLFSQVVFVFMCCGQHCVRAS